MIDRAMGDMIIAKLERKKNDISDQVRILYNEVLRDKPPAIIECGVRAGMSSRALLAACCQYGGKLFSYEIDPRWQRTYFDVASEIRVAGAYWSFSILNDLDLPTKWKGGLVRFMFIDTSHELEQTRKEMSLLPSLLDKGGSMYFHDTTGLKAAGVKPAIEEFLKENADWKYCELGGEQGLGKLTKP